MLATFAMRSALITLLSATSLARPTVAASLPDDIVKFYPPEGSMVNSTIDAAWHYGFTEGPKVEGAYSRNVTFSLTYPNGTVSPGGGVSSGNCPISSGTGTYTFGFVNNQTGLYVLDAVLRYGLPPPGGNCSDPFEYQDISTSVNWTLVPSTSGGQPGSYTTKTAQFLPSPTGSIGEPTKPSSANKLELGAGFGALLAVAALVSAL